MIDLWILRKSSLKGFFFWKICHSNLFWMLRGLSRTLQGCLKPLKPVRNPFPHRKRMHRGWTQGKLDEPLFEKHSLKVTEWSNDPINVPGRILSSKNAWLWTGSCFPSMVLIMFSRPSPFSTIAHWPCIARSLGNKLRVTSVVLTIKKLIEHLTTYDSTYLFEAAHEVVADGWPGQVGGARASSDIEEIIRAQHGVVLLRVARGGEDAVHGDGDLSEWTWQKGRRDIHWWPSESVTFWTPLVGVGAVVWCNTGNKIAALGSYQSLLFLQVKKIFLRHIFFIFDGVRNEFPTSGILVRSWRLVQCDKPWSFVFFFFFYFVWLVSSDINKHASKMCCMVLLLLLMSKARVMLSVEFDDI